MGQALARLFAGSQISIILECTKRCFLVCLVTQVQETSQPEASSSCKETGFAAGLVGESLPVPTLLKTGVCRHAVEEDSHSFCLGPAPVGFSARFQAEGSKLFTTGCCETL